MMDFITHNTMWIILGIFFIIGLREFIREKFSSSDLDYNYHTYKKYSRFGKKPHTKIEEEIKKYGDMIEGHRYITTKTEALFFRKLQEYTKDKDYIICPKVRLGDIIEVKSGANDYRPYSITARTEKSHIDFVLIGKSDLQIRYAIELDDPSHESEEAHERDHMKDKLFEFVNIPLIRFNISNFHEHQFIEKGIL